MLTAPSLAPRQLGASECPAGKYYGNGTGLVTCDFEAIVNKHWIVHSCFQQRVAVWLRSQRVSVASCGTAHHPQKPALQEFNHSLACPRQLVMAPGAVIFECEIASPAGVIVHHPQKPALQEFNHSLTRLSRQLVMAPGVVIFESCLARRCHCK